MRDRRAFFFFLAGFLFSWLMEIEDRFVALREQRAREGSCCLERNGSSIRRSLHVCRAFPAVPAAL